jgi:hypothetical protein
MSYPFLYWGRSPADWFEGANDGHTYEIRFANVLTAEQRVAVGRAFFASMKKGPATAAGDMWQWAGAWTIFRVGEKRGRGGARAVFDHMDTVFRAIHEVAPIAEIVFWCARAPGEHPWDLWTREQGAAPAPGPTWRDYAPLGFHGRARDPGLGSGEPDTSFELARSGKNPPKPGALSALRVTSVLPGVSGWPEPAAKVAIAATLPGALRASRPGPSDTVVALTTEGLFLVADNGAGAIVSEIPAEGAVQLAVIATGIAVTMAQSGRVRAYRIAATGLEPVAQVQVKKSGPLWANGDRVFFSANSSSFELTGW